MNITQFLKLLQKNIAVLIAVPVLLALLVFYFTRNEAKKYVSSTVVYTGIASGMTIESQEPRNVDFFGVKIVFDNFINIIESRETMEETGIELFANNLMLSKPNREFLSEYNFKELQQKTPASIKALIVKGNLEATKEKMLAYKNSNDTNYLYRLLNLNHPHYSVKAISGLKVQRIENSDLIKIEYSNDDPGITKQTLLVLTRVFIRKYKSLQQGQSMDVVRYFEEQVELAAQRLKDAEDRLLHFNQDNNIINYYEQSKYIAAQKEELDVKIQNIRMELVSAEAAVEELESKLNKRELIKLNSQNIVELRNKLSNLSSNEAFLTATNKEKSNDKKLMALYRKKVELKKELELEISKLTLISASKEGLPSKEILSAWLANIVKLEESKSQLNILNERKMEFELTYQKFAPLGATMKRIEREIDVAERAYLELLHSLSLAKLKQQNIEMSSTSEIVDAPFFPIEPQPSKRKILIAAAFVLGFLFSLALIIILEYLDSTIKNTDRAIKFTELELAGVYPKIVNYSKTINIDFVRKRMIEMMIQNIGFKLQNIDVKLRIVSVLSTQNIEGKTFIGIELAKSLLARGYKVLFLISDNSNSEILFDEPFVLKYKSLIDLSEVKNVDELIPNTISLNDFDYVFVEFPSLIYFQYSTEIIKNSQLSLLVLRSNRAWNKADKLALDKLKSNVNCPLMLVLNGVDLDSLTDVLGEIPKSRSRLRRIIKKLLTLQIKARYRFK